MNFQQNFLIFFPLCLCYAQDSGPSVDVTYPAGTVRGFHVNYGSNTSQLFYGKGDIFLGIPFAQPPVGNRRFQKPAVITTLPSNPYNATDMKPACPQSRMNYVSEDCLYLNVFSPNVNNAAKYPVMIWIHGGALMSGSASDVPYKGVVRNFLSRGVVVVVIQYRLGMLGFFTTFTDDFPANLGMLDQVEAIKWVKNNILAFGGNPNQITLFGTSAGGASVSAHTYSPLSQNLFHGAIMQSGVALTVFDGSFGFTDLPQKRTQQICNITSEQWSNNNLPGLKQCLMSANFKIFFQYDDDMLEWKLVQDDYFMPNIPSNLANKRPNIPVMLGSNKDEWAFFVFASMAVTNKSYKDFNKSTFEYYMDTNSGSFMSKIDPRTRKMFENVYVPPGTSDKNNVAWIKATSDALTCIVFTGFIGREAELYLLNNNSNVFLYEFTYASSIGDVFFPVEKIPEWNPVLHGAEYPFLFAKSNSWEVVPSKATSEDYKMLDWFAQTWTDFAKLGVPNTPITWNPVSDSNLQYYQIDAINPGMQREYRKKDQVLYNQVIPVLIGDWPPYSIHYQNVTLNNVQFQH